MSQLFFQKALSIVFTLATLGYACISSAHDAGAIMDPNGNVASFTGYGQVTCFDDGNGPPDHLVASVQDTSLPQENLLVNLQIIQGKHAINTTDAISGDGRFSDNISVFGGQGPYLLLVNKTGPGLRKFIVSYHCMTFDNVHTGTSEVLVHQFQ
ncbi:hypothetical protein [Nitrosomonas supralitoralis]|uniref:Lipoprotein n=1 Tax=Nitrosomonas supralitoralis TaxID=2116706 RepID=A0A2P7NXE9_9PROT|nr:hypothetical protein [Nitrosomonas supralitoralis]PSJ18131.1 hypothetical protein C7H79_04560 [Nitrosomonas supralitoralis]